MKDFIPVTERLPRHNQHVLMAWDNGVAMLGRYFRGDGMLTGFAVNKGSHYVGKIGVTKWKPVTKSKGGQS